MSSIEFAILERIEGIKRSLNEVHYNVLAEIVIRLDTYSPVGNMAYWKRMKKRYKPGKFRGNWMLGINQVPTGYTKRVDPSGKRTVTGNLSLIPGRAAMIKEFHLVNNAPYAQRLEDGWSRQAPYGMISRINVEFPSIVEKVCQEIKDRGGRVR